MFLIFLKTRGGDAALEQRMNYQKKLEEILKKEEGRRPRLLLQCCCAPCSSYVLEYLSQYFEIDLFFYNPNIDTAAEFELRRKELWRLADEMGLEVGRIAPPYCPEEFLETAKGLEEDPEGGSRCKRCFELRLERTAQAAARGGYDYFTTTLSISPLKNAALLNTIGERLAGQYGVDYLFSDFKKKEGYKRSITLSAEHGLYRQDYCGCRFSRQQREREKEGNVAAQKD